MSAASRPVSSVTPPALISSPAAPVADASRPPWPSLAGSVAGVLPPVLTPRPSAIGDVGGGQRLQACVAAQPDPDPGQQLGQRERLGQVVLRAALQAVDLGRHVRHARQDDDRLARVRAQQPAEHLPAVQIRHYQVQDDKVVMSAERGLQPFGPAGGELGGIPGSGQRPADERADLWLVIDDQDATRMRHCHLPAQRVLSVCSLSPVRGSTAAITGMVALLPGHPTIDCAGARRPGRPLRRVATDCAGQPRGAGGEKRRAA